MLLPRRTPLPRHHVGVLLAILFVMSCTGSAVAGGVDASAGFTLDPAFGSHAEPGGITQFDGSPLLTLEGSVRYDRIELYAEGLPPVVALNSSGTLGSLSTKLGFVFAVARFYVDKHWSLGIGESIYDQTTTRTPSGEVDRSNIAGLRYELRHAEDLGRSKLSLAVAATPVMSGGVRVSLNNAQVFDGERAAQTEVILRDETPIGKSLAVLLGARYLNYSAMYAADDSFADRNHGVLITVGILARLGH